MKSIFTFLFLILFSLSIFAQNSPSTGKKSETFSAGNVLEQQVFTISSLYPNPVKDQVTIEIQSKIADEIQLNLYNILGAEVKKWEPNHLRQGSQKIKLDLSLFKSGVYILRISGAGQVSSQVIKKN